MNQLPITVIATLAWRNLWRNHRRTIIMLTAITIGVWAMIFMTALLRGMVDDMVNTGIRNLPGEAQIHHTGYRDDPGINNSMRPPDERLLNLLNSADIKYWSRRVNVPAVISSERESRGITLIGIDPDTEQKIGFNNDSIIDGRFLDSADDGGIILGAKLIDELETRVGKRIVIMSQDPDNNIADRGFRIVGSYKAKLASLEKVYVYAGIETVQQFLHMDDNISEIAISNDNYRDLTNWLPSIKEVAGNDREALAWYDIDTYLGSMMTMMDGFVLVWMVVVFLALSFGLINTLVMAVFERVREIGLMLALGMRPGLILSQILVESLFLLCIGLLLGNIAAYVTIVPLQYGINISAVAEGMEMMGTGSVLYPVLKTDDVILANVVVILLGLLTSILPAWRASRYDPIEAINKN